MELRLPDNTNGRKLEDAVIEKFEEESQSDKNKLSCNLQTVNLVNWLDILILFLNKSYVNFHQMEKGS